MSKLLASLAFSMISSVVLAQSGNLSFPGDYDYPPFDVKVNLRYVEFIGKPAQGLTSRSLEGDRTQKQSVGLFQSRSDGWLFRMERDGNTQETIFRKGRYESLLRTPNDKFVQNFASDQETLPWSPSDFLGVGFRRKQAYGEGRNWAEIFKAWRLEGRDAHGVHLTKTHGWIAAIGQGDPGMPWKNIEIRRGSKKDFSLDRWSIKDFQKFQGKPFPKDATIEHLVRSGSEDLIRIEADMRFEAPIPAKGALDFKVPEGTVTQDAQLGASGAYLQRDGRKDLVDGDYGSADWERRESIKRWAIIGTLCLLTLSVAAFVYSKRRKRSKNDGGMVP